MSVTLSLSATDFDEEILQDMTRRLRGDDMTKPTQMIVETVEGIK